MRLSDLGVDELIDLVNDPATDPELRERAARFLRKVMDIPHD
jgi:hypothetical protein